MTQAHGARRAERGNRGTGEAEKRRRGDRLDNTSPPLTHQKTQPARKARRAATQTADRGGESGGPQHFPSGAVYSSAPPILTPACSPIISSLPLSSTIACRARTPSRPHLIHPEDGPFQEAPCPAVVSRNRCGIHVRQEERGPCGSTTSTSRRGWIQKKMPSIQVANSLAM